MTPWMAADAEASTPVSVPQAMGLGTNPTTNSPTMPGMSSMYSAWPVTWPTAESCGMGLPTLGIGIENTKAQRHEEEKRRIRNTNKHQLLSKIFGYQFSLPFVFFVPSCLCGLPFNYTATRSGRV